MLIIISGNDYEKIKKMKNEYKNKKRISFLYLPECGLFPDDVVEKIKKWLNGLKGDGVVITFNTDVVNVVSYYKFKKILNDVIFKLYMKEGVFEYKILDDGFLYRKNKKVVCDDTINTFFGSTLKYIFEINGM